MVKKGDVSLTVFFCLRLLPNEPLMGLVVIPASAGIQNLLIFYLLKNRDENDSLDETILFKNQMFIASLGKNQPVFQQQIRLIANSRG
jgi:cadmium resistance protein CadD (predicted permease)